MLQFSFAAHDFLYLYTHICFNVNKPNFHFKGKGRFPQIALIKLILVYFSLTFLSQTVYHFSEFFVAFSLANVGCNYGLNGNSLNKN